MEKPRIKLGLEFEFETRPKLIDITALLYDLELLHDFTILVSPDEDYPTYKFSQYFWYRNGRPIREEQKLRLLRMSKQSPLIIEILLGANLVTTSIIAFLESIQMIRNWTLDREKLRLEVEKLKKELNQPSEPNDFEKAVARFESDMDKKNASRIYERIERRLDSNPSKLKVLRLGYFRNDDQE